MNLFYEQWAFLKASLFSTGGMGNLPSLHSDLATRGLASDRQFTEALTIGQISPGPNGLWVISFGYLHAGMTGAIMALIGICIPPFLVLLIRRVYVKIQHHPAVEGFVRGLGLSVMAVFAVILARMFKSGGIDASSIIIAILALSAGASKRVPIVAIIAIAAGIGMLAR